MLERYSVAEARQHFSELVRRAERGRDVEITRRGRPVAVLVSAREYAKLTAEGPPFREALASFRNRIKQVDLLPAESLDGLRSGESGRDV